MGVRILPSRSVWFFLAGGKKPHKFLLRGVKWFSRGGALGLDVSQEPVCHGRA